MSSLGTPAALGGEQLIDKATYGAARSAPHPDTCCIMFGNIQGFPSSSALDRSDIIQQFLTNTQAFMFSEHNSSTLRHHTPRITPSTYHPSFTISSHLPTAHNEPPATGGTGLILGNPLSKFILSHGSDSRSLGRWTWITLRGKSHKIVTFITVYRSAPGWASYNSQLAAIRHHWSQGDETLQSDTDPSQLFLDDLRALLQSKLSLGSVIVGGDFNDNLHIQTGPIPSLMRSLHLTDCFRQYQHLPTHTYSRGSHRRIDGIFSNLPLRAGYYDFISSPSDHMWMFAEISYDVLLGINKPIFPKPPIQRATPKNPIVTAKYNTILEYQCTAHRISEKIDDLECMLLCDVPFSCNRPDAENLHHQITTQVYQALQCANTNCRKIREGPQPYSTSLKHARTKIRFWKLLFRRVHPSYRSPTLPRVRRFASFAKYTGSLNLTPNQVSHQLSQAKTNYKNLVPSLYEKRKHLFLSIAQAQSMLDNKPPTHHLTQILHRERMRRDFKSIRAAVGKVRGPPLTAIEKDTPNGRILIIDDDLRDQEIINCHKGKLMAANNTPLRQLPISSILGEQGDLDKWQQIASNDLTLPPSVDPLLREWLQYLQQTMPGPQPTITWTEKEYHESWKLMKEETGSGPGPTFSIIKSVAQGSTASKALSIIALAPLQTGFVPLSWQIATEQCIPKKTEDLRPSKTRRITLFNCQLNHNKKLLGKRMMSFGEANHLLAPEQYGSRHGKSSIIHALNKRLVFDWMRLSHTPGIYIANDAKGCYDRIILLVAYLTMRRMGIPHAASSFSVSCLLTMVYRVRTAWGLSSETYGGSKWFEEYAKCPHGAGQGSGDGPALWAGISSPLFDLMRRHGHCFHIASAITSIVTELAGFSFVDDTDYLELLPPHLSIHLLHPRAQQSITTWEKLLRSTGGALEPTKSDWVWIEQQWIQGRWTYVDRETPPLHMSSPSGQIGPLTRLQAHDSRLTLGVYQSPPGDESDQVTYLQSKVSDWCDRLQTSHLTHKQVQQAVSITINSTITYSLPATCFNPHQCKLIQSHLRQVALPRMGVIRTAASVVVYGPKSYGGLGLLSIRLAQVIAHIRILLTHGGSTSIEGNLIKTLTESSILEAGFGCRFFSLPPTLPWMSETWLWHTHQHASYYSFRLHTPSPTLHCWRANDKFIMHTLFQSLQLSATHWRRLNHVRIYLQVVTISDITNNSGTHLLPSVLRGTKAPSLSANAYTWPALPSTLNQTDLSIWRQHISSIFLLTPTSLALRPRFRLTHWLPSCDPFIQWWQTPDHQLFHTTDTNTFQWTLAPHGRFTRRSRATFLQGPPAIVPPASSPVMLQPFPPTMKCDLHYYPMTPPTPPTSSTHWALRSLFGSTTDFDRFAHLIRTGKAQLLSDGSFKSQSASSCFLCVSLPQVGGTNIVPGHVDDASAHRGEMAGLLSQVLFANHICQAHNITSGPILGASDCLNAIRFAVNPFKSSVDKSCYDLCNELHDALQASPLTWTFQYVPGHQDDKKPWSSLTQWERANVRADSRAKAALTSWREAGSPSISFPSDSWGVSIGSSLIRTSKVSQHLSESHLVPPLQEYWISRLKTTDISTQDINWHVFKRTMLYSSAAHRRFRTKHMAHISATGINLVRRGHQEFNKCPHCGVPEDNLHISICASPAPTALYTAWLPTYTIHLLTCSDPFLISALHFIIQWSRRPLITPPIPFLPPPLLAAVHSQMNLGIRAFQWGFYSPLLTSYLQSLWVKDRRSPTVWFSTLSNITWRLLQDLWILRNQTLHGPTNALKEAESDSVNIDLIDLYHEICNLPLAFLPSPDRRFFQRFTLPEILSKSLSTRKSWLRQAHKVTIAWRIRQDQNPAARNLREWLLYNPPDPLPNPDDPSDHTSDTSDTTDPSESTNNSI